MFALLMAMKQIANEERNDCRKLIEEVFGRRKRHLRGEGEENMSNEARMYIDNMKNAGNISRLFLEPSGLYFGKEGHKRFAKESGYALNDFIEADQKEIPQILYGAVYVVKCNLKPLLDAREFISIMRSQIKP